MKPLPLLSASRSAFEGGRLRALGGFLGVVRGDQRIEVGVGFGEMYCLMLYTTPQPS